MKNYGSGDPLCLAVNLFLTNHITIDQFLSIMLSPFHLGERI